MSPGVACNLTSEHDYQFAPLNDPTASFQSEIWYYQYHLSQRYQLRLKIANLAWYSVISVNFGPYFHCACAETAVLSFQWKFRQRHSLPWRRFTRTSSQRTLFRQYDDVFVWFFPDRSSDDVNAGWQLSGSGTWSGLQNYRKMTFSGM